MPFRSFGEVFEPTEAAGDVRLGRDSFEAMSDASSVMPYPTSCYEAVQGLMFIDSFN